MTSFQVYDMLIAKELITVADSIMLEKAKDFAVGDLVYVPSGEKELKLITKKILLI